MATSSGRGEEIGVGDGHVGEKRVVCSTLPVCLRESSAGLCIGFVSAGNRVEELEDREACVNWICLVCREQTADGVAGGDFEDEVGHLSGHRERSKTIG